MKRTGKKLRCTDSEERSRVVVNFVVLLMA